MRPFATHVANPIVRPLAGRLPFFGVLTQVGRKTGRVYRHPVNVLRRDGFYVIALTYGPEVNWVKNVVAAGGCEIRIRGRDVRLGQPEVFEDRNPRFAPLPARPILRLLGIRHFVRLRPVDPGAADRSG
jgi:deazaflavin-dependent oxidoreductase (nitroreductase family)